MVGRIDWKERIRVELQESERESRFLFYTLRERETTSKWRILGPNLLKKPLHAITNTPFGLKRVWDKLTDKTSWTKTRSITPYSIESSHGETQSHREIQTQTPNHCDITTKQHHRCVSPSLSLSASSPSQTVAQKGNITQILLQLTSIHVFLFWFLFWNCFSAAIAQSPSRR